MITTPSVEQTPDGHRFVVDRVVDADPEAAWDLLTDTTRWTEWGPSVSGVRSSDRIIRQGTTGKVQVAGGPWVPFEIATCADYRWTWRVARIPATGHRVEPVDGRTRVVFEIPVLAGGYAVVCRRALERIEDILEGDG
jgi:hypothetical protein